MKMIEAKKVVPLIRLILFDNPNIEKICKGMQDVVNIHTIEAEPVKWKPVVGYEGLYEVNEYGQIKNTSGKIMRQRLKRAKYTDYKKVSLWKDGKYKHLYVSRIVAEAFIQNPSGLPFVNHKDEDGTNNWVGNLEWCDRSYNAKYGSSPKKLAKAHKGKTLKEEHKEKISAGLKAYYSEHDVWNKGCHNCGGKDGRRVKGLTDE